MKTLKNLILIIVFIMLGVLLTARFDLTDNVSAEVKSGDNIYANEDGHSKFAVIAKDVMPAVVNIKVERSIEYNYRSPYDKFFESDPFFEDFFGRKRAQPKEKTRKHVQKGEGSGFIYSTDGYIMTNNHVVEKADKIVVRFSNGDELDAEIIGTDPETDLAVIKVDKDFDKEEVLELGNSDDLWVGDWVIAIGSPYSLEKTVTVGVVSAKDRSGLGIMGGPVFQDFIQTDAAINPGNSGGPLLSMHGKVIGINAAVNSQAQGIGFAIPINLAKKVATNLQDDGIVKRAYLGIFPKAIVNGEREPLGLDEDQNGILIATVEKDTPAEEAGLKADDIIIEMNGKPIDTLEKFRFELAGFKPDEKIKFVVLRDGKEKTFNVKLGDRGKLLGLNNNNEKDEEINDSEDILGLSLKNVNKEIKDKYKLSSDEGIIITKIDEESQLFGKLAAGDVVTKAIIAGVQYKIDDIKEFKKVAKIIEDKKVNYIIKYLRKGRKEYILIKQ
ncbi:MAG: trypsin-like peptidase domain-containing protein [Candidatus Delongbacteria bacterium]|jgi:serine protease Do|nr:trypsin-like peptidase domain-containing protein [Candidatus Delongbacteria bacterium]